MNRDDLARLSKAALVEAYLALQAKLQRPSKTSRTSSKPPSTDKKARRDHAKPGGAKPGHEGHNRALHENPDETIDLRNLHQPTLRLIRYLWEEAMEFR